MSDDIRSAVQWLAATGLLAQYVEEHIAPAVARAVAEAVTAAPRGCDCAKHYVQLTKGVSKALAAHNKGQRRLNRKIKRLEADAARYRWLCNGNGYFMEERSLCHFSNEKSEADAAIDEEIHEGRGNCGPDGRPLW
jgi:hypothetical protein